jgi:aerobic carbon-monoxide dehydrogenase medium subunit
VIPRFRLERPTTLEAAFEAMSARDGDAAYLAGGTELLQVMKMGLLQVDRLVDLKGIAALRGIAVDGDAVVIGALATHREIERSPIVVERLPELAALEHRVANARVRTAGTLGGNLAFAEPHSDPATLLLAVGATIELVGPEGTRTTTIDGFLSGPLVTNRAPDEILRSIRVPFRRAGEGRAYEKIAFRERPTASVAVVVTRDGDRIDDARVVVGSLTDVPTTLPRAAEALRNASPDAATAVAAAWRAEPPEHIDAADDHTGSADYKRYLAWELIARATTRAIAAAA